MIAYRDEKLQEIRAKATDETEMLHIENEKSGKEKKMIKIFDDQIEEDVIIKLGRYSHSSNLILLQVVDKKGVPFTDGSVATLSFDGLGLCKNFNGEKYGFKMDGDRIAIDEKD